MDKIKGLKVPLETIEKSEAEGDQQKLTKYFRRMKDVPSLDSSKCKSRLAEYHDDLRIFIDKWEGRFGV